MSAEQLAVVREFCAAFARRQAAQVREVDGGVVVLHPYTTKHEARAAHTGNKIINHGEITQEVVAAQAVDQALERQGTIRWSESSRRLWRDTARDESLSAFNEQMSRMGRYYR